MWASEKIECLHFIYALQSSLSFLSLELINHGLYAINSVHNVQKHVQASATLRWHYVQNCGTTHIHTHKHTVLFPIWRTYVWLHQPCSTSARQKSQFARSTTNINISNLLCCATANRTDTTQRVLINHDYEAPLAAASLGSQWINSIPILSVGTPCMMIQVVR